jgi:hypothetical protein
VSKRQGVGSRLRDDDEFVEVNGFVALPHYVASHPGGVESVPARVVQARREGGTGVLSNLPVWCIDSGLNQLVLNGAG